MRVSCLISELRRGELCKEGSGMCRKGGGEDTEEGETVSGWCMWLVQATSMKEKVLFEADEGW